MADGITSPAVLQSVREQKTNLKHYINTRKRFTIEKMIKNAIIASTEKRGATISAIKKFMLGTYLYDVSKKRIYIDKFLKAAVADGRLIKSEGRGVPYYKLSSDDSTQYKTVKPATNSQLLRKLQRETIEDHIKKRFMMFHSQLPTVKGAVTYNLGNPSTTRRLKPRLLQDILVYSVIEVIGVLTENMNQGSQNIHTDVV
ncbi:histone H1-like, partial [Halyomorpha halys]|uniref:histone H1-like n=1 Tax=Halyomorpha halys TaxID=286706 RepID=UPI0034D2BF19